MAEEMDQLSARAIEPTFWSTMMSDYRSGMANVVVLTGNVHDYVDHPKSDYTLRQYLEARLGRTHTVVSFAPDQGITFPGNDLLARESRARFDQVLGLESAPPPDPDSMAAILARESGQAGFGGDAAGAGLPSDAPSAIRYLIDFVKQADEEDPSAPQGLRGSGEARQAFPKRAAVIIERADLIVPPADKGTIPGTQAALLSMLHRSGTSVEINRRRNLVVILAPSLEEVHPDLRLASANLRAIEVEVPDHDQRLAYVARTIEQRKVALDGLDEVALASETAGLGRRHIEDIAMRAAANGGKLTRAMVRARKAELIRSEYAEVLEVLDSDVTFDMVGGHDLIKGFLADRVIPQMRDPELWGDCPMGVLFAGPSGTGKTYLARALAHESGFNCVALDASKIRGSYVGESEKKLAKAIKGIKALSPAILFVDEIDTRVRRVSGGGSGGDSVESNIFGTLLEFFSDTSHRGRILLVAATNRPDNIDAALKRPGRIDVKAPLLPPADERERADALAALVVRHRVTGLTDAVLLGLGRETDGWTQAELEGLVVAARAIQRIEKLPTAEAFAEALEETAAATADVELHTRLALEACNNRRLVPPALRDRVGKQVTRPKRTVDPVGTARQAIVGADDDFDFAEEAAS